MKKLIPLSLCLFIISCGQVNENVDSGYYAQNFDDLKMWNKDAALTDQRAHSGTYAAFTDSTREFSETFEMNLHYALSKGYHSATVSAWCQKTTDSVKAGLVASIDGDGKPLVYQSNGLTEALHNTNAWEKISLNINFPANPPSDSKLKIYMWSPNKSKTFLDDLEVRFYK